MKLITWDWEEQPDIKYIIDELKKHHKRQYLAIHEIETKSDCYAVVIGAESQENAQAYWDSVKCWEDEE